MKNEKRVRKKLTPVFTGFFTFQLLTRATWNKSKCCDAYMEIKFARDDLRIRTFMEPCNKYPVVMDMEEFQ
jgi:TctA family transporter